MLKMVANVFFFQKKKKNWVLGWLGKRPPPRAEARILSILAILYPARARFWNQQFFRMYASRLTSYHFGG